MLVQLQALSLLDVTLLQSRGYPVHVTYSDFVKRCGSYFACFDWLIGYHGHRYSVLLLDNDNSVGNDEEICHKIITNAKLDGWKIGKSQVTNNDVITSQSHCVYVVITETLA